MNTKNYVHGVGIVDLCLYFVAYGFEQHNAYSLVPIIHDIRKMGII